VARLTKGRETPSEGDETRPDAAGESSTGKPDHSLKFVFGGLALVSIVVGVLAYWRYANSERWVAEGLAKMDEIGAQLDAEGCIDEAVAWYDACDQHDANAAVCLQGVGILMHHCLSARDRAQTCELYLDPESPKHQPTESMRERARNPETAGESGRWVYARCEEREMVCRNKRECACAEAYRAIDSFCRTGQQAVQL
jgi:hypothetical protein